jgi:hypothetical protein
VLPDAMIGLSDTGLWSESTGFRGLALRTQGAHQWFGGDRGVVLGFVSTLLVWCRGVMDPFLSFLGSGTRSARVWTVRIALMCALGPVAQGVHCSQQGD